MKSASTEPLDISQSKGGGRNRGRATLPLTYLAVVFLRWTCSHSRVGQRLVHSIKSQIGRVCRRTRGTGLEESQPDRLINPCHYNSDRTHDSFH